MSNGVEKPKLPPWLIPVSVSLLMALGGAAIVAWAQLQTMRLELAEVKSERLKQIEARIDSAIVQVMPGITESRTRITDLEKQLDRYNARLTRLEDRR